MTIADKLTLLASSKEALRVKLELPESLPFSEYYKLAIRKPFEPSDLFVGGTQGAWYDPSDKSTLFQDVVGTVPVTKDGDPVALMRDKSGNSNHAVQTVSTARPVYKTDGILHWLEFDGVDDFIQSGTLSAPVFTTTTGVMSAAYHSVGGLTGVIEEVAAIGKIANRVAMYASKSGGGNNGYIGIYAPQASGTPIQKNTEVSDKRVVTAYSRDNRFYTKINSEAAGDDSITDEFTGATLLTVGMQTTGRLYFSGEFYAAILVGGVNNDSNISKIGQYLANKSGVTL